MSIISCIKVKNTDSEKSYFRRYDKIKVVKNFWSINQLNDN